MDAAALASDASARIRAAAGTAQLEELRVEVLGRKAPLTAALRELGTLPPDQRAARGAVLNEDRKAIEGALGERRELLERAELDARLAADALDVTLPAPAPRRGFAHVLQQTEREIVDIFTGLGFQVAEGPEIELAELNFDALNTSPTHPSRQRTDTYYVTDDVILRTQTSPVQAREMARRPPPIYIVCPGRVYRRETVDATHGALFTQVEGLAVDRGLTLAHLKGILLSWARAMFGPDREVRLRPHFFPFTEPSVEADVSCFNCARDGSPCRVCRGEGWIEVLGAGMVDPNVLAYAGGAYADPAVSGFAWGMGVERIAMLRHGITDLRLFWENDLRFLEQFG